MSNEHFPDLNTVIGNDTALREKWAELPGEVQLRILRSGACISTLGELEMISEHMKHSSN